MMPNQSLRGAAPTSAAAQGAGHGINDVIAELARLRDALRLFPASWTGAATVHREALQVDALLMRLQRVARPSDTHARSAMERFAALLECGTRPESAMQIILRENSARQFQSAGAGSAPLDSAA